MFTLHYLHGAAGLGQYMGAVSRPRFRYEYLPEEIQFDEYTSDDATREGIDAWRHTLAHRTRRFGKIMYERPGSDFWLGEYRRRRRGLGESLAE